MINQDKCEKGLIMENRPWGSFTVLEEGDKYKVKKLVINPHQRLSLQMHQHRDEHWVVAEGTPLLRCGDISKEYNIGECIVIKKVELHRIENKTDSQVIIIEIQNGDYLGEDDIIRIEDDYSRVDKV
ncbi:MAG: hypothetical protein A2287_05910 [Candidatus Melainabacteria bacterium RIFOXYA12_FULL_32_12]|nr:MAG: hypothetical protein A2255_03065 [Candidatus Melainabacteria bacterium RIFOXYA2_FULL_32_9]OGI30884.1 MAG: hypothetical protein A2287_05910 [Candidatus Melainabacteria bacterium RIFOXYA12_FULL_32_12]